MHPLHVRSSHLFSQRAGVEDQMRYISNKTTRGKLYTNSPTLSLHCSFLQRKLGLHSLQLLFLVLFLRRLLDYRDISIAQLVVSGKK